MDLQPSSILPLMRSAGAAVMEIYRSGELGAGEKSDQSPVTKADDASNHVLQDGLASLSEYPIVSEETEGPAGLPPSCWLLDPLDGTSNFIRHDGQFCIMAGLLLSGRPSFGAVYAPASDEMLYAQAGRGAYRAIGNSAPARLSVSPRRLPPELRAVLSKNHLTQSEKDFIRLAGIRHVRQTGSIGIKLGLIARGEADVYATFAALGAWDLCAPEIILSQAGGSAYGLDGWPISYASRRLKAGVVACNGQNKSLCLQAAARVLAAAKKA